MTRANCWAHARRQFFELADVARQLKRQKGGAPVVSPLAKEALEWTDQTFAIERESNGRTVAERLSVRQERVAPLVHALEAWMREKRGSLSRHDAVAKAIAYMLNDWDGFTTFLADGQICLTNNAAERELRSVARGRKAWLFVGSDRGGERAAMMYSLRLTWDGSDFDCDRLICWLRGYRLACSFERSSFDCSDVVSGRFRISCCPAPR